jgi:DNA polymerase elongation subunit (family B)
MEALVWGRRDVNIGLDMIQKDWQIIAFSAKWLGQRDIYYTDLRNERSDIKLLSKLRVLLNEADIVITQNGKSFDCRKINARLIYHGMTPPSPYRHIDTYRIAKNVADFTSNSLEYLTSKLCSKYTKLKHTKFPGISLWIECLKGNTAAWNEMKRYNIHDTLATEELYGKLKAWIPESMARIYYVKEACRLCGPGTLMWHKGFEIKKSGRYHRYQCQKCYAWTIGGKAK